MEKNDIILYKEFIAGNNEAFNEIIKKYKNDLINFIFKYVKNIELAEDISQDTFVYVLINKIEYDFKYSLRTYLYTIAKSKAINYLKKYKREIPLENEFIINTFTEVDFDKNLTNEENKKIIYESMSKLKSDYQIILYLREFKEFTYKEICTILNKTMPQVKIQIYRAKKELEKIIKRRKNYAR